MGWGEKRGTHSWMVQLVGYLDLGCTQPQANPKRLVSFSHAGGGDPVDFLMSLGSVLPGCVSSAASCISVARWLFKMCRRAAGADWSKLLRSSSVPGTQRQPSWPVRRGCGLYFSWIY